MSAAKAGARAPPIELVEIPAGTAGAQPPLIELVEIPAEKAGAQPPLIELVEIAAGRSGCQGFGRLDRLDERWPGPAPSYGSAGQAATYAPLIELVEIPARKAGGCSRPPVEGDLPGRQVLGHRVRRVVG